MVGIQFVKIMDSTDTWYPGDRDKQDTSGDAEETSKG